jgi:hypothetical protein
LAITLGKDATLTVGTSVTSVRNVEWTATARTLDVEEYGSRYATAYSTGWDASVSFEVLESSECQLARLTAGELVAISGGVGSWSFDAIITSVSESNPLDGVTSYQVEARMTRASLR